LSARFDVSTFGQDHRREWVPSPESAMNTDILPAHGHPAAHARVDVVEAPAALRFLVPVARLLFSAIFIMSGATHFSSGTIGYAASQGVPMASVLVPLSGVLAMAGGLSILTGFKTRIGALLIVVFLVPVTLMMHAFWRVADPTMHQLQQVMFMKNVAMLGGALLLVYFGGGPVSADHGALHRGDE
jgi:putative oxidoreductase